MLPIENSTTWDNLFELGLKIYTYQLFNTALSHVATRVIKNSLTANKLSPDELRGVSLSRLKNHCCYYKGLKWDVAWHLVFLKWHLHLRIQLFYIVNKLNKHCRSWTYLSNVSWHINRLSSWLLKVEPMSETKEGVVSPAAKVSNQLWTWKSCEMKL